MVTCRFRRTLLVTCLFTALAAAACEKTPLLAPTGSTITLTTASSVIAANGSAEITAVILESAGTPPHSGTLVTFTTTIGTLNPAQAETDASGQVTVQFVAGNSNGVATIVANSGGATTGTTGALKISVGTAAVGKVTLNASPATVPAIGGSTLLTANVFDVNGNPLPSAAVIFSSTAGSLSSAVVTTTAGGVASTTLTTSQTATVTASVGAQAVTTGGGSTVTTGTGTTTGTTTTGTTNSSGQASASFIVNVSAAPTLVITPPTTAPSAGLPANYMFAVTAATANGSAVRDLTVNWGAGLPLVQDLGAVTGNATVSHIYADQGTYTILATVTDAAGDSIPVSTAVSVVPTPNPSIQITPTVPACVTDAPCTVSFQLQVTVPAGVGVQDATIAFGDGNSEDLGGLSGSLTTSYTYTMTGTSDTVRLTVLDTLGRTTQGSTSIVVP